MDYFCHIIQTFWPHDVCKIFWLYGQIKGLLNKVTQAYDFCQKQIQQVEKIQMLTFGKRLFYFILFIAIFYLLTMEIILNSYPVFEYWNNFVYISMIFTASSCFVTDGQDNREAVHIRKKLPNSFEQLGFPFVGLRSWFPNMSHTFSSMYLSA